MACQEIRGVTTAVPSLLAGFFILFLRVMTALELVLGTELLVYFKVLG